MLTTVRTRVMVKEDGTIEAKAPGLLPAGQHEAVIVIESERARRPFRIDDLPVDSGPWDDSVSLRREDLYGDDGR